MSRDRIRDVRTLALQAAARGWLGSSELWEIASSVNPGQGTADSLGLLERALGPERLAHLSSEPDGVETQMMSGPNGLGPEGALPITDSLSAVAADRYELGETLGRGGAGRVASALDRATGRIIARKTLHGGAIAEPHLVAKFVREARIAAQLEHPGIVPVYDIGVLEDGQPFYTMRVVKRTSLRDVLNQPELRKHWPLGRMLSAFLQVCRALEYAHSRGVLHRDIKPENVLLGDFGEVYLSDFGVAKVLSDSSLVGVRCHEGQDAEPLGGTAGYIAPEVFRTGQFDHRADLFALGVVLYEVLTGKHPFDAGSVAGITLATCEREPIRPSEIAPSCPLVLEDLCLSLLAKRPDARPTSAEVVAAEIIEFLEGAKERERRRQEAVRLSREATEILAKYAELEAEAERQTELAKLLSMRIKEWEPVDHKRSVWALEDAAEQGHLEAGRALASAIESYKNALEYDPAHEAAHRGLADLYWLRARAAAAEKRRATEVYYEALVRQHDDGSYESLLTAPAHLSVSSNPAGAEVVVRRYEERDRVLVPGLARSLGRTPILDVELDPGSYLVVLEAPGCAETRYPVLLSRGARHVAEVNLYTDDEIGEGFVYVPGGVVILGDDPNANDGLPRQEIYVPDFAIGKFPVTMREYCAFLDALDHEHPELARRRAPRDRISEGLVVRKGSDGRWEPDPVMIEGEARKLFPIGEGHEWALPAHLIDWFDAVAYCRWRSEREGAVIRLPNEAEWEKAARGVDGRYFPWGDHFDPAFCLMRASRPFPPQPEPIGTFATDQSPYGVRDMAGGMREWVGDIFGERSAEDLASEPEPSLGAERGESGWRQVRSGSWNADRVWPRAASRGGQFALVRGTGLGFRIAKSLTPRPKI